MRDVPWNNIFKLSASAGASEFCEWVQVGIDVYIPHQRYQVKPHSSSWFSAAFAAAIVHRNHFFHLYQKDKSSESKVKFRQASNLCKMVLETAKLTYDNKTKESTPQKLGSRELWQIANSVLNKGKSAIPPLFNGPKVWPFFWGSFSFPVGDMNNSIIDKFFKDFTNHRKKTNRAVVFSCRPFPQHS